MRLLRKVSGIGTALLVWERVRRDLRHPSGVWFGARFVGAATVVVDQWGPRWARKRLVGDVAIGAWLLLLLWLGVPIFLLGRLW
jgi:hypothetical protein